MHASPLDATGALEQRVGALAELGEDLDFLAQEFGIRSALALARSRNRCTNVPASPRSTPASRMASGVG